MTPMSTNPPHHSIISHNGSKSFSKRFWQISKSRSKVWYNPNLDRLLEICCADDIKHKLIIFVYAIGADQVSSDKVCVFLLSLIKASIRSNLIFNLNPIQKIVSNLNRIQIKMRGFMIVRRRLSDGTMRENWKNEAASIFLTRRRCKNFLMRQDKQHI